MVVRPLQKGLDLLLGQGRHHRGALHQSVGRGGGDKTGVARDIPSWAAGRGGYDWFIGATEDAEWQATLPDRHGGWLAPREDTHPVNRIIRFDAPLPRPVARRRLHWVPTPGTGPNRPDPGW